MTCNDCVLVLKELGICNDRICTESQLRKDIKHAFLKLHPDKGGSTQDFQRFYNCLKFMLENYHCYYDDKHKCNTFLNKKTKSYSVKASCIKTKHRNKKYSDHCPGGSYYRKPFEVQFKCTFPHTRLLRFAKQFQTQTPSDDLMEKIVEDPVIVQFFARKYKQLRSIALTETEEVTFVLTNKPIPTTLSLKTKFEPLLDFIKIKSKYSNFEQICNSDNRWYDTVFEEIVDRQTRKVAWNGVTEKRDMLPFLKRKYPMLTEDEILTRTLVMKYPTKPLNIKTKGQLIREFKKKWYMLKAYRWDKTKMETRCIHEDPNFDFLDTTVDNYIGFFNEFSHDNLDYRMFIPVLEKNWKLYKKYIDEDPDMFIQQFDFFRHFH